MATTNGFVNGVIISGGGSGNTISVGPYASLPGSANSGDMYQCSDTKFTFIYSGSAWTPFYGGNQVTLPPSSSWTWDNQGSSTATNALGTLNLVVNDGSNLAAYYRTAPSTPYTVTSRSELVQLNMDGTNSTAQSGEGFGMAFRDAGGKIIIFMYFFQDTNWGPTIEYWNSTTSFSSSPKTHSNSSISQSPSHLTHRTFQHLRIADDGANLLFSHSVNGIDWVQFYSASRTAFMASGPTQVGLVWRRASVEAGYSYTYDWTVA